MVSNSKSNLPDPNLVTNTNTGTASRPISPHVPNPELRKPHHHHHDHDPFTYPVSLSGRGFIPKGSLAHLPHPHPKAATPRSDNNGCKDSSTRDRSSDDVIIRDRKVRITEDASLYALCRSWLRNGVNDENKPQQKDVTKALPKPLPASTVAGYMSDKKEEKDDDEHEENEESVELLLPQDLLMRHIKRAKTVRARLREQRLQRIQRYRYRLRLLLPPLDEEFRNDTAAGNRPC